VVETAGKSPAISVHIAMEKSCGLMALPGLLSLCHLYIAVVKQRDNIPNHSNPKIRGSQIWFHRIYYRPATPVPNLEHI